MTKIRTVNLMGACLMILLLVMQFVPFWQYGEAETASIQGYIWFPSDHSALDKEIKAQTNDSNFEVGSIVLMPVVELLICSVGAVLCTVKADKVLTMLFPAAAGVIGICGYLKPAFRLGSLWPMQIILCVLLLAIGIFGLVKALRADK